MRPDLAGSRRVVGLAAAGLIAAALSLAGCGGSSASPASPGGGATPAGTPSSGATGGSTGDSSSGGSLASSPLIGLTKLSKAKLCGVLSMSQAAQVLGSATQAPAYANRLGLGTTCEWFKTGASSFGSDELYVGTSTIIDWTGAQAVDQLLKPSQTTIDGHQALTAGKSASHDYALVHVALGGDHDPVAEFRAPTLAIATQLATTVTPRLLALR